jgi:hypothetical protein
MTTPVAPYYDPKAPSPSMPLPIAQTTLFYSDEELNPPVSARRTLPPKRRPRRQSKRKVEFRLPTRRSSLNSLSEHSSRSLTPRRSTRSPTPRQPVIVRSSTPRRSPTPSRRSPTPHRRSPTPHRLPTPHHSPPPPLCGFDSELSSLSESSGSDVSDGSDGDIKPFIKKPPGEAGRPESGGYNLPQALGWAPGSFATFQVIPCNFYIFDC